MNPFSWMSAYVEDQSMISAAKSGIPVGWEVYDRIPEWVDTHPSTLTDAYAQAAYLLAVGARRADQENENEAQQRLVEALDDLNAEHSGQSLSWACTLANVGCPVSRTNVLSRAIQAIEDSGLNPDDTHILTITLKDNLFRLQLRKYGTYAVGLGIGAGLVYLVRKGLSR